MRRVGALRAATARELFWALMAVYPAFVFQRSAILALLESAIFFAFSATLRGGTRLLPSVVTVLGIAVFNLLTPIGRILMRIGDFPLTLGALEAGLRKGTVLAGMVQLSRAAVGGDLRLPGKAGEFTALVFRYFDRIAATPLRLKEGGIAAQIDAIAAKAYGGVGGLGPAASSSPIHPAPTVARSPSREVLGVLVAGSWALLAIGFRAPSLDDLLRSVESLLLGLPRP